MYIMQMFYIDGYCEPELVMKAFNTKMEAADHVTNMYLSGGELKAYVESDEDTFEYKKVNNYNYGDFDDSLTVEIITINKIK